MSRRAAFTQAEYERIMRASKKTGVPVEVDLATGAVRVLTVAPAAEQMTDLQKFRAARDAKRASQGS